MQYFTEDNNAPLLPIASEKRTFYLYPSIVITLSSLFLFYKYLLQVSPSVITDDLMRVFHISGGGLGNLAAMYFYSYVLAQLAVGILLDKYSPRLLTSLAIVCCALGSIIFSIADTLWVAAFSRLLVGAGAAFATISYMKMASIWFRPNQFAFIGGLLATAAMLGALCGEAPLAFLVQYVGWRNTLLICGLLGLGIAGLFYLFIRDKKSVASPTDYESQTVTLKDILHVLRNKLNWFLALYSGLAFAPVAVFGGLWGNPFLQEAYHFTSTQAASLISLLFIGVAIGGPLWGYLADRLKKRQSVIVFGTGLALIAILLVIYSPHQSLLLLEISLFLFGLGSGAFMLGFAIGKEINKAALAATVVALINTGDAIFGAISEPLVGKVLDGLWTGQMVNGVPHFSVQHYQIALLLLPIDLIGALLFIGLFHWKNRRASFPTT
ncbi:MFS transporter [Coxiella burnetii]|uniref:Lysosomal dipeptide transporter MFSD1 n=1 Tax=Coxiella burnetii (strain Dugway 5J108-111) TaxID=434922 RepID=A9KCM1_COXBN|nr:MFS transporter [Coxiella burnetii]ABS77602.1 transporter, MFS superfamily [Coxiella burnetii Dugway 5J108-111]OYK80292.1 MFS transporter [Coxiella burnetii]OYK82374.1 MFS transporter [Coxiella burnetii]